MAITLDLVLLVAALICFALASFGFTTRIDLGWLGLALWVLTALV